MKAKTKTWFVGDPCYAIDDRDVWLRFCDHSFSRRGQALFTDPNTRISIWARGTIFGDGTYHGKLGGCYGVDAGLIGVASVDHLGKRALGRLRSLGKLVEFSNSPRVTRRLGVIRIFDGEKLIDEIETSEPG